MRRSALLLVLCAGAGVAEDARHEFEMQVRPVLAKNCWACHQQSAMGGLRLDSREAIVKGGKSGPALVEGKSLESLLIRVVNGTHDRLKMPPSGKLPEADVSKLASWIDKGAYWPPENKGAKASAGSEYKITPEQRAFWAFQPVAKPAPDASIDRFVNDRLREAGLRAVPRADKRALLRRATLDLTGLPPSPA
ncbi:MAG: DUF1549 domain-containing protein, partial [Bryobacteraceae bacterium]|nr:DUF1549 domain-containing protein [Bryobacteraceae bacterium]